ncbi:hypothetical protein ES319_D11G373700v1 [Gossypium barbadense]|uniref:Uncharacterized protein n=3 Tax=Gossypium TaxID=3633 RepID=A0A5J5PNP3_GOSBA|nr:hypothetical protein ES319_D11G373700v1 [Gossypium barbadense]TYG48053.1 hypothetical protein ES288_D11G392300v1 [Gossypium darwinii]TYH47253.1 hypothetical protein ES332_D11G398000v1 [Gossypium tomentosum]
MPLWLATIHAHNIKFYLVTVHCCYIENINGLESTLKTLISLALKETPCHYLRSSFLSFEYCNVSSH